MIIQPKVRGFICTTAHPTGCASHIQEQIDYVKSKGVIKNGPRRALIIGASTGYGLASRVMAAFGAGASTIGVFFERASENGRTATAGWYNSAAFEQKARAAGLYARSFNGDAFSDDMRRQVVEAVRRDLGAVDLIVYSLASPRRQHPRTGEVTKSVLRPIGQSYTNKSIDLTTNQLETVTLPSATAEEIAQTVAVMGGEDWEFWMDALGQADLLSKGCLAAAYSYIGPELTRPIYRNGTIGRAKDHLEATAKKLDARLKNINGRALVSVNKALVTQSSSAIPFIPLYFIMLKMAMKARGVEEGCIEQMRRLFAERLYSAGGILVDVEGRVRMDDWEMREDIQQEVGRWWEKINRDNLKEYADLVGYQEDFMKLFGFGLKGVDYTQDVDPAQRILSIPDVNFVKECKA